MINYGVGSTFTSQFQRLYLYLIFSLLLVCTLCIYMGCRVLSHQDLFCSCSSSTWYIFPGGDFHPKSLLVLLWQQDNIQVLSTTQGLPLRLPLPSQACQPGRQHTSRAAPPPPPLGLTAWRTCSLALHMQAWRGPVSEDSLSPLRLSLYFTGIRVSHHFKERTPSSFWNRVLGSITTGKRSLKCTRSKDF